MSFFTLNEIILFSINHNKGVQIAVILCNPTGEKTLQCFRRETKRFKCGVKKIILTINELRKLKHALDQMGLHSVTHNIPEPT